MKRKTLSTALIAIAFTIIIALLAAIFISQQSIAGQQEKMLDEDNAIITAKLAELEAKVDTDTVVQIKECEMKAVQTVINIFSPQEITKDSTVEYDFNIFSDDAYEYYLMQRKTFAGQQLITTSANGSGYDTRTERIQVFVPFFFSGYEGRTQFNFTFAKIEDKWIIESFSSDS